MRLMMSLILLCGLALGAAASRNKTVTAVSRNANNVFSRAVLRGDNYYVKYLGQQETEQDCITACEGFAHNGVTCKAWTYHTAALGGDWALGCYGSVTFLWAPTSEANVDSGKNARVTWPAQPVGQCADDAGCNYNGACDTVSGACRCEPQWKGPRCNQLNLLPARSDRPLGYRGRDSNGTRVTSWGGSTVIGDDGTYWMYAAEITHGCGMNVWLSNSRVIVASSPDPASVPFTRRAVLAPAFAHEPIAQRAPTGEFVVFYTAANPPPTLPINRPRFDTCTGCADGNSAAWCATDSEQRNASINLPTYMVYAKAPTGPWSAPQMVPGTNVFADSNFAPVIRADGSLVALTRGAVVTAKDWRDVSSYDANAGVWHDAGEDPYVWQDAKHEGVLHNIVHVNRENTHGLHTFSTDGLTWQGNYGPSSDGTVGSDDYAYTNVVTFSDGAKPIAYGCRERPHVVLARNGSVVALTNGAAEQTCHSAAPPVVDYSYTLLQMVGQ